MTDSSAANTSTKARTKASFQLIHMLPTELFDEVLNHLDPLDVALFKMTSKAFGDDKPEFTQALLAGQANEKRIMLANVDGGNPMVANDANLYLLKTRDWDYKHFYWTLDVEGEGVIIKHSGSFRAWRGIGQGYSQKTMVYPLPVPSEDVGALSRRVTRLSVDDAANTHDDAADDR
ncbi:MAG: hypothetical protein Q9212_002837, partial [Teloschistes hypoglaucus]